MASVAAADQTPANMDVLPDTALNAAPVFPFHVCHKNGYFIPEQPVFEVSELEVILTPSEDWNYTLNKFNNTTFGTVLGLVPGLVTANGFFGYANGWDETATTLTLIEHSSMWQQGRDTRLVFFIGVGGSFGIRVYVPGSEVILVEGQPTGFGILQLGYPTKEILAAPAADSAWYFVDPPVPTWRAAEGLVIKSVTLVPLGD